MFHLRLLILWGVALTMLSILSSITIKFVEFIPGLILMWVIYGFFLITAVFFKTKSTIETASLPHVVETSKLVPFFIAVAYIIFFPLYIKFYTGSTVTLVIFNLINGISNYQNYQDYFNSENLGQLSITKLPFIIGAGVLKFLFIGTVCRVFGYKEKVSWVDIFSIIVMVCVTIILSVSRGTTFEFFELIMIFIFGILLRRRRFSESNWFTKKSMLLLGIIGFFLLLLFGYNIDLRGDFSCATDQLCYDDEGGIAQVSSLLGRLTYQISGYFLFGLFFTSIAVVSINFGSINGFAAFLVPSGLTLFKIGESYRYLVCDKIIDCGAAWIPDIIIQITNFGLIGLVLLVVFLGFASSRLFNEMLKGSIFSSILLYFIFIYMISLPVGNFLTSSSANVISIFCALMFKHISFLEKFTFNYFKIQKFKN